MKWRLHTRIEFVAAPRVNRCTISQRPSARKGWIIAATMIAANHQRTGRPARRCQEARRGREVASARPGAVGEVMPHIIRNRNAQ